MKFCDKCGNLLKVKETEKGRQLHCKQCDISVPLEDDVVFSSSFDKKKDIMVFDGKEESEFPTTKVMCPKCEMEVEAFWTMQQTRGGDEAPTRFYECKICKYRWREYS